MNRPRIRQVVSCMVAAAVGIVIGTLLLFGLQDVYEILQASAFNLGN
jgi:hypothetical protein